MSKRIVLQPFARYGHYWVNARLEEQSAGCLLPASRVDPLRANKLTGVVIDPVPVILRTTEGDEILNQSVVDPRSGIHHPDTTLMTYVIDYTELDRPEDEFLLRYRYREIEQAVRGADRHAWKIAIDRIRNDKHLAQLMARLIFHRDGDSLTCREEQEVLQLTVSQSSLEKYNSQKRGNSKKTDTAFKSAQDETSSVASNEEPEDPCWDRFVSEHQPSTDERHSLAAQLWDNSLARRSRNLPLLSELESKFKGMADNNGNPLFESVVATVLARSEDEQQLEQVADRIMRHVERNTEGARDED